MADAQSILSAGLPTLAVLIAIPINNSPLGDFNNRVGDLNTRLNEIRSDMHRRFNDLNRRIDETRDLLLADFRRVEQVWAARRKHLQENR